MAKLRIVPPAAPLAPPQPAPETSPTFCPYHPTVIGKLVCKGCGKWFCSTCVNRRRVSNKDLTFCRTCGEECLPVEQFFAEPYEPSFFRELPGAFAYPFRGEGLFIFMGGCLLYLVLHGLGYVTLISGLLAGVFIIIARLLLTGYIIASVQALIEYSAQGDNRPFTWPELHDLWSDIIRPVILFVGTCAVCFAPAVVAQFYLEAAALPLLVLGAIYLPMGMLAVALFDSFSALNPLLILLSIFKVPLQYLVVCVVLGLAIAAEIGIDYVLEEWVTTPFLIVLFSSPIAFYFITVETRILGLLYNTNKSRLDWFG